jgi:hypothetical protein
MTTDSDLNKIFNTLFAMRGGYSLPVLVQLHHAGNSIQEDWFLTNSSVNITFEGVEYQSETMEYTPPQTRDGVQQGGQLQIAVTDNNLINWLDALDSEVEITVNAVIVEAGEEPLPMGKLRHKYGSVSWDGEKIIWQLSQDDRLHMQINPWKFDAPLLLG